MIEKILKILSEPVLTTDGRSHYIDESHRRYLASRIAALLEGDEEGLLTEADQILSILCAEIKGMGLSEEEQLACSLISKYPFEEVEDVIKETCLHRVDKIVNKLKEGE